MHVVHICINDYEWYMQFLYREWEAESSPTYGLHCLMDRSKPALFQTVSGIDDLQAFEELKEAWYAWVTTKSKMIKHDFHWFSRYGHVAWFVGRWSWLCFYGFLNEVIACASCSWEGWSLANCVSLEELGRRMTVCPCIEVRQYEGLPASGARCSIRSCQALDALGIDKSTQVGFSMLQLASPSWEETPSRIADHRCLSS